MNGYNFTERVRKALALAREEAARLRHEYVGTEHVLLGILCEGEGIAVTALENLNVDLTQLRDMVEETAKPGPTVRTPVGPDLPYTSRAKKTLELAMAEAHQLNQSYVGTEHLLLGLLREAKGIGGECLQRVGVTLGKAREEVERILNTDAAKSPVRSMDAVRGARKREPWGSLEEPLRAIVADAYTRANADRRPTPLAADLLEALVLSSTEIAAAFASAEVDFGSLVAAIRRAELER